MPARVSRRNNVVRGQTAPRDHLCREEVDGCEDRHMGRHEIFPCDGLIPFWSGCDAMPPQNVSDRLSETLWPRLASAPEIRW